MINVYEGIKGVKKVKSENLRSTSSNLGALPSGVTVLLSENRVEFSVTLEGKRHQSDDVVWLGFHYSASFQKFKKVFSKTLLNPTFEQVANLLHKSLIGKFDDPYSSPLYITGANDSKAFWTISLAEDPQVIYGHIPLHRSDSFHTLQSYPILYLEDDMQVIIGTDIDRNQLFPSYPKIDELYTQTLHNIQPILHNQKWSVNVIPGAKLSSPDSVTTSSSTTTTSTAAGTTTTTTPTTVASNTSTSTSPLSVPSPTSTSTPTTSSSTSSLSPPTASTPTPTPTPVPVPVPTPTPTPSNNNIEQHQLLTKNQFDLEKLAKWFMKKFNTVNTLAFVYGLSFYKKGCLKTVDMITLKSSSGGKSFVVNLVETFRLQPQLEYFKDQEDLGRFETDNLHIFKKLFTDLENDCQAIKNLIPSTSVSIYNPFFDKHIRRTTKIPPSLTVESSFLVSNNSLLQQQLLQQQQQQQQQQQTNTSNVESPRTKKSTTSSSTKQQQQQTQQPQQQQQTENNNSNSNNNVVDQVLLANIIAKIIKEQY